MGFSAAASTALVETLLQWGGHDDVHEAAIDVALLRLQALLARARGDEASYRALAMARRRKG
jgi:hypothetical protein